MENVVVPRVRTNFNTMQFLKKAGLDAPIGGDMFLCGNASSGPSQLPKVCPARMTRTTRTTGMPSGSSTNGYVSWSGVVGPSQLPKVCPVRTTTTTTTTGMPSGSSTNGYVSWSGVVVFTSSASVMTAFNGLILGACGLILYWIVGL
jgi:hypothetical protein